MRLFTIIIALVIGIAGAAGAGYYFFFNQNKAELDTRWVAYAENSEQRIDHSEWQLLLDDYLVTDTDSGVNLFDYAGLLDDGRETLDDYIASLVAIDPLQHNRQVQKAYWINLYNALTVQLIIDNYPLTSITNLGSSKLEFGPWNDISTRVNNIELSLNDIEHRIIRPLYNDYRIHFAVNCASIGCPNLAAEAFTADSLEQQLDDAAAEYLEHPRGITLQDGKLHLSSLFDWYADDFGSNQTEILATLGKHISPDIANNLASFNDKPVYAYDWGLNGYCSVDNECGQ